MERQQDNRQTDRQTYRRTNGQTDKHTNGHPRNVWNVCRKSLSGENASPSSFGKRKIEGKKKERKIER